MKTVFKFTSSIRQWIWVCLALAGVFQRADAQSLSEASLTNICFEQKPGAQVSPDLQFWDENGKFIRLGDYFGKKPIILVLGYYRCPMLCSFVENGMIGSLQDIKWDIGNEFDVVNVSIDPHETAALADAKKRSYVKRYGRPGSAQGWHFLTGQEPDIRRLADSVGFGYEYDPSVNQYAHPSGLVILTPQGKVSQYLSGVVYSTPQLKDALVAASQQKVGTPISQFFLLCFHYSPITGKYGRLAMFLVRACGVLTLCFLGKIIFDAARQQPATSATPPKKQ
jgi:protein SCO1/2